MPWPACAHRNGCVTSEDLFWKLDALQSFIRDLHWPDAEFRQHLEQRLKLMACDMIDSCITRTESAFQSWLRKGVTFISTDYIMPSEMCAMVNVILDAKNQSFKLCAVDGIDVVWYSANSAQSPSAFGPSDSVPGRALAHAPLCSCSTSTTPRSTT